MNAETSVAEKPAFDSATTASITAPKSGNALEIGGGFSANAFRERDFAGAMDPLVMVDHYRMSEPTFGAHPHAGISTGARTHGLQVFVNLPARMKKDAPESLRVKAQDMPVLESGGNRVRIVLGASNGITGRASPALPMTILDGTIAAASTFEHDLQAGENSWVYAIKGEIEIIVAGEKVRLQAGEAIAIEASSSSAANTIELRNIAASGAHFALLAAAPVKEAFVQKGPFVMSNEAEIEQVEANYAAGKLGHLE